MLMGVVNVHDAGGDDCCCGHGCDDDDICCGDADGDGDDGCDDHDAADEQNHCDDDCDDGVVLLLFLWWCLFGGDVDGDADR